MKTSRYKQALGLLISAISNDFLYATEHSGACKVVESVVCEKVISTIADAKSSNIPYNFNINDFQVEEHTDTHVASHKARHFCEVHEGNAEVNRFARGTRIELINVPDSFQNEMVEHVSAGYTELTISNGMLCGSKLKISDDVKNEVEQVVIDQLLNQDIQVHIAIKWQKPNARRISVKTDRFLQEANSTTCFDDPDFWFIRDNNLNSTCAWLTSDTDIQDIRIEIYCDRPHIKYACPHTCLELQDLPCECPSNTPNFEFVMLNIVPERNQTCSWITRNRNRVETRRKNYCYSDYRKVPVEKEGEESVGENCINSCFCTGGYRSSSPSLAPSDVPTKTPSMSPSKTPSTNPSELPTLSPSGSPTSRGWIRYAIFLLYRIFAKIRGR